MPQSSSRKTRVPRTFRSKALAKTAARTSTAPRSKTKFVQIVKPARRSAASKQAGRKRTEAQREGAIQPGEVRNPNGNVPGQTLWQRVQEKLKQKNAETDKLDSAADAFIGQLEKGNYAFHNAVIERQEGKVPDRVANADGSNVKFYRGLPVDGDDAP